MWCRPSCSGSCCGRKESAPRGDSESSVELAASASVPVAPAELRRIEECVSRRKEGHVTIENVYVVSLVAAWSSVVLLLALLCCGAVAAAVLPSDLAQSLLRGYGFFQSVSAGYYEGVSALSDATPLRDALGEAAPHCVSIYMSVPRCAKTSASDHPPQAEAAKRQECARDEDSGEGRGQGYS